MTDALSIGWTRAQAATQHTVYRRVLGFALIVQTALAIIALVAAGWLTRAADLPGAPSAGWVRLWGIMLLITAVLYLPGWIQPVYSRWPNVVGILARFVLAVTYVSLGGGLRWFALYELVLAIWLAWSYGRLLRAELMSRP
jgi:hypothetical protein